MKSRGLKNAREAMPGKGFTSQGSEGFTIAYWRPRRRGKFGRARLGFGRARFGRGFQIRQGTVSTPIPIRMR